MLSAVMGDIACCVQRWGVLRVVCRDGGYCVLSAEMGVFRIECSDGGITCCVQRWGVLHVVCRDGGITC